MTGAKKHSTGYFGKHTAVYGMRPETAAAFKLMIIAAALCALCVFLPSARAYAEPTYYEGTDKASVEDKADILSSSEETELLDQAGELSEETGFEIRVVTTDDAGGMDTDEYAENYFESLSETYEGGCYVLDLDNRQYYVATYGDLQYYLTDDRIDEMLDSAYDDAVSGEWAGVLSSLLSDTEKYCKRGIEDGTVIYNEDTGTYTTYEAPKSINAAEAVISAAVGLIAFLAMFVSTRARYGMKIPETNDYSPKDNVSLRLSNNRDILIDRHLSRVRIPRDPPGGGGGHGGGGSHISTTHSTGGGHSAGGGGRHF